MLENHILPSLFAADPAALGDALAAVSPAVTWVHCDVFDGTVTPELSFGPSTLAALRKRAPERTRFDVHLCVTDVASYLPLLVGKAHQVSFHPSAVDDGRAMVQALLKRGLRACVSLAAEEGVELALPLIDAGATCVNVLTIPKLGLGGQSFEPRLLAKVSALRQAYPSLDICVDGGITPATAPLAVAAGANWLVAGTAIFGQPDPAAAATALASAAFGLIPPPTPLAPAAPESDESAQLPESLWHHVLSLLDDVRDVLRARAACRAWRATASADALWHQRTALWARRFGLPVPVRPAGRSVDSASSGLSHFAATVFPAVRLEVPACVSFLPAHPAYHAVVRHVDFTPRGLWLQVAARCDGSRGPLAAVQASALLVEWCDVGPGGPRIVRQEVAIERVEALLDTPHSVSARLFVPKARLPAGSFIALRFGGGPDAHAPAPLLRVSAERLPAEWAWPAAEVDVSYEPLTLPWLPLETGLYP